MASVEEQIDDLFSRLNDLREQNKFEESDVMIVDIMPKLPADVREKVKGIFKLEHVQQRNVLSYLYQVHLSLPVVKYLLIDFADPEGKDVIGRTVLLHAASSNKLDIVKYLVSERKVNIHHLDRMKQNVLHRAASGNCLEVIKYLIEETNVDYKLQDKVGYTALHFAAINGFIETVKYLTPYIDVNIQTVGGYTPLYFAAMTERYKYMEVISHLVTQCQADVTIKSYQEKDTVLEMAIRLGKTKVINLLGSLLN